MPMYDYECRDCKFLEINRMERADNSIISCPKCGGEMHRLFHAQFGINMGAAGAYGYYDENLETYIETNKQRREEMRKQGVTEKGDTPKLGDAWI